MAGNASVYLPVVHFTLLIYSPQVAEYIKENGYDLEAKNDYAFMKNVLNMLASLFEFQPQFKIEEFFAPSTAIDRKVSFIITLTQMVKAKDAQLNKRGGGKAKPKSVTFRQDDSVALPKDQNNVVKNLMDTPS